MDERARLAIGGSAVVATSAAVVLFVALSNAAALLDTPGASIGQSAVLIPTPTPSTPDAGEASEPSAAIDPAAVIDAPAPPAEEPVVDDSSTGTVTVPAPEPVVVAPPTTQDAAPTVPTPEELDDFLSAGLASGSWDAAREWARAHGWSDEKAAELIARLEQRIADSSRSGWRQGFTSEWSGGAQWVDEMPWVEGIPVIEVPPTDETFETGENGTHPTREDVTGEVDDDVDASPTQTPASAGPPAAPGSDPGDGEKKDRSRESPDRRD